MENKENSSNCQNTPAPALFQTGNVCPDHDTMMMAIKTTLTENGWMWEHCPDCHKEMMAERQAHEASQEEMKAYRANKEKESRIARKLSDCAIGKRFMGKTFDDFLPPNKDAEAVLNACRKYAETFSERKASGDSLIFLGNCGTGKNMLAACICQEVIKQDLFAFHTTVFKMIRRIKDTWRKDSEETENDAIHHFTLPDLLVIDEVGVQFGSDTEKLYLTEVINERYERMLPTILISNLTLEQLEAFLGERIIDRFYEGKKAILNFTWKSYRRQ